MTDRTDMQAEVDEAMVLLKGEPVPYALVLVTVLESPEEIEAYMKRGVHVLYSNRDDKWRALEVVERVG